MEQWIYVGSVRVSDEMERRVGFVNGGQVYSYIANPDFDFVGGGWSVPDTQWRHPAGGVVIFKSDLRMPITTV